MMKNLHRAIGVKIGMVGLFLFQQAYAEDKKTIKPNVLFIAVDDLNHWVGHLGRNKQAKTPNIDRLAKLGVTFYSFPTAPHLFCNPSRAAILSGKRPSTTGVYDNGIHLNRQSPRINHW